MRARVVGVDRRRRTSNVQCCVFKDVVFQGIAITGAARAGDINGFKGDTLKNLEFMQDAKT